MRVSEFIQEAREELYMGYTKNAFMDSQGNVCSISALKRVAMRHLPEGGPTLFAKAKKALQQKAAEMFPDLMVFTKGDAISIPGLHDSTQKDDMIALFDKAQIGLEEVGL